MSQSRWLLGRWCSRKISILSGTQCSRRMRGGPDSHPSTTQRQRTLLRSGCLLPTGAGDRQHVMPECFYRASSVTIDNKADQRCGFPPKACGNDNRQSISRPTFERFERGALCFCAGGPSALSPRLAGVTAWSTAGTRPTSSVGRCVSIGRGSSIGWPTADLAAPAIDFPLRLSDNCPCHAVAQPPQPSERK